MRTRLAGSLFAFEKHQQLIHRHAPAFIRDVLDRFRQHHLTVAQATDQLGISPSRLYALATTYLCAAPKNKDRSGSPAAPAATTPHPGPNPFWTSSTNG
jgi:hypothetical protein